MKETAWYAMKWVSEMKVFEVWLKHNPLPNDTHEVRTSTMPKSHTNMDSNLISANESTYFAAILLQIGSFARFEWIPNQSVELVFILKWVTRHDSNILKWFTLRDKGLRYFNIFDIQRAQRVKTGVQVKLQLFRNFLKDRTHGEFSSLITGEMKMT